MNKLASLALSLLVLGMGTASDVQAKTWNLRMTSNVFDTHPVVVNGFKPWIEDIKKATNGQVKIRYFNPNTICHEGDIASSTVSGVIDIGTCNLNRNLNEFPLHDMFTLPMVADTATAEGVLGWRMYREFPALQKEVDAKFKVLGYWGGGVLRVGTTKKPVKSLEDLQGLRIIAINKPIADIVTALGANPIIVPFADAYMALARNQADGIFFSLIAAPSAKFEEFIRHVTEIGLESDLRVFAINRNLWDSFPPDIQQAFESLTGDEAFTRRLSRTMDDGDAVGRKVLEKAGARFYSLSAEENARWVEKLMPLYQAWAQRMADGGFCTKAEAEALLKRMTELAPQVMKECAPAH